MTLEAWGRMLEADPELRKRVDRWLKKNPPPVDWKGTPDEWAYTEMIV